MVAKTTYNNNPIVNRPSINFPYNTSGKLSIHYSG